jgi:hypothetical protein
MSEIVFVVEEAPEGGFVARAVGESIFTEADNLAELHERYFRSPPGAGGRYYLNLGLVPLEDSE